MGKLSGTHFSDWSVRSCMNKRRFESEAACVVSIIKSKAEIQLRPYKCPLCGFWHKTKQLVAVQK